MSTPWPWMVVAVREYANGVAEIAGEKHNARILAYHATTTLRAHDDETPWCSSFVNYCIETGGGVGTKSAAALSWSYWGREVDPRDVIPGDVCVLSRVGGHHVGFVVAVVDAWVLLLGGNQGNRVSVAPFPLTRVVGFRRQLETGGP